MTTEITLIYVDTLEYYDGPLLFTARDESGGMFLCSFGDYEEKVTFYVCASISQGVLEELLTAKRDVLSVFKEQQSQIAILAVDGSDSMIAKRTAIDRIDPQWLPGEGYFMEVNQAAEPPPPPQPGGGA